jgi:hypothetical protein
VVISIYEPNMATFPLSTGTLITDAAYNELAATVIEIMGPGEDGYGLFNYFTTPITTAMPVRARSWGNLTRDLVNTIYHHVAHINTTTNTYSTVLPVNSATSGSAIGVELHNKLKEIADFALTNRYTCAEEQYYRDPDTGVTVNTTDGVSTRTTEWGVSQDYIEHRVRVRWANRLIARYFFNGGGYITWTPYHSNNGLSELDAQWASFINNIQTDQGINELRYDRAAFLAQTAGTTATIYPVGSGRAFPDPTYEQGPLSCNVEVFKANNEAWIQVKATFRNSDSSLLVVVPTVGYWNFTV